MAADTATGLDRMRDYLAGDRQGGGLVRLLGIRPVAVERGVTVFESEPNDDSTNSGGNAHGGYLTTLLDTAMGCAALSVVDAAQTVTTIELKVAFLRPVPPRIGRIIAEGRVITQGRRIIFTEATLTDANGRKLATASSSLMVLER